MEWPPDKERLKRDLYIMAGCLAVMLADVGVIVAENPRSGLARAAIGITALPAATIAMVKGEKMYKDDYEVRNRQLTIFGEEERI